MERLKEFWLLVVDVWEKGFLGINISDIIVSVFILVVAVLFRRLFSKFVIGTISRFTKRTKTDLDENILKVLDHPLRFIPIILGVFFVTEYLSLTGNLSLLADNLVRSLIVFVIFWALVNTIEPLSFLLRKLEQIFTKPMVDWLIKAIKIVFIFIGIATILEIWGIKIGPI